MLWLEIIFSVSGLWVLSLAWVMILRNICECVCLYLCACVYVSVCVFVCVYFFVCVWLWLDIGQDAVWCVFLSLRCKSSRISLHWIVCISNTFHHEKCTLLLPYLLPHCSRFPFYFPAGPHTRRDEGVCTERVKDYIVDCKAHLSSLFCIHSVFSHLTD